MKYKRKQYKLARRYIIALNVDLLIGDIENALLYQMRSM